jgi:hypothetical protein
MTRHTHAAEQKPFRNRAKTDLHVQAQPCAAAGWQMLPGLEPKPPPPTWGSVRSCSAISSRLYDVMPVSYNTVYGNSVHHGEGRHGGEVAAAQVGRLPRRAPFFGPHTHPHREPGGTAPRRAQAPQRPGGACRGARGCGGCQHDEALSDERKKERPSFFPLRVQPKHAAGAKRCFCCWCVRRGPGGGVATRFLPQPSSALGG